MTRYRCIKSSVDLHLQDRVRNHDKVYHLAVFERDDGNYDVLYRYGRRGTTMRLGILKGGENICDYRSASNLMTRKEAEQVNGDGYQYASGITPDVWKDLLPTSFGPEKTAEKQQPAKQPEPAAPAPEIGGDGPKTWFW
ncbi:hypothetical protein KI809_02275 [Geobacter pelophilus]|uniref:WGR domain-containing protein n=1 Tax=Geoanaerobacter pelophilus TaxID=60036 RepID=A0AAW4L3A7_9BACT|nr:hypothetical protein [Geoanaerobacter pelophilus]MBT0663115.1 hypothetical protein [Geoanaerobacter pelophilus]